MNTTLTQIKGLVGIMMHGSIESEGEKINKTFIESLTKILELQQRLYLKMKESGFYKTEMISDSKIKKVLGKHENKIMG